MNLTMIIIVTGILFYLITCLALLDIAKKNFGSIYKKSLWGFLVLIPFIGCIIYFVLGYRKGKKSYKKPSKIKTS